MLTAGLILGAVGFVASLILSIASRVFYVYVDPRIELVEDCLAGANCGGCGYPGCNAAATAVVAGKAPVSVCIVGGPESAQKVAEVMGLPVEYREPEFSERLCRGGSSYDPKLYNYIGIRDCRAAYMLGEGPSLCEFSCLGFGTCERECPFYAITINEKGLPEIDYNKCTGCGTCERVCPKHAIWVTSESEKVLDWNTMDRCAAPCQATCPAQINIPRYINFIAEGKYEEALRVIKEHNPLPLTCGRVCPAPCEDACRRRDVDEAVNINNLKRFVADLEYRSNRYQPVFVHPDTGHKVAIIGGGPAGLTCAYYLRRLGHSPTIIESLPKLGGALQYGIPAYRLPKEILDWEIQGILSLGIEVKLNTEFGKDITYEQLMEEGFEALFIATGTPRPYWTRVPGEDLQGVIAGIEFLRDIGLGKEIRLGKKIVVIGGGNVAIDVALSSLRLPGVEEVHMVCLEKRDEMPAWEHEIHDALSEGVVLHNSWGPKEMLGSNGKVIGVEFKRCVSVFDENGRFSPKYDESELMKLDADNVIVTIGQGTDIEFLKTSDVLSQIETTPRGTIVINPDTMQTNIPHIFASGEIVTGPNIAVQAIAGGRKAAWAIHQFLKQKEKGEDLIVRPIENLRKEALDLADRDVLKTVPKVPREQMQRLSVEERKKNFKEVNLGLTEEQALRAAKRCLNCGIHCFRPSYELSAKDSLRKVA